MFKGLFQFIFGLMRLLFIIILLVLFFHTWVIKQAVTFSLSYQLGADVSVQGVKMDWRNTGFEVQGLEIGNPYSFPKGTLADIPLAIVSFDLHSLSQKIFRIKTLGVDIREIRVMNVARKGLNLLALKNIQKGDQGASTSPTQEAIRTQMRKYAPKFIIDELIFSISDISYWDMSGPTLKQTSYKTGIKGATYYDIRGSGDVTAIIVAESMKKMGFAYLGEQLQRLGAYGVSGSAKSGFMDKVFGLFKGEPQKDI